MAGTIVHLLVAERLLKKIMQHQWEYPCKEQPIFQPDYFIAGNICPDGIMTRKNYQREMKLHTHFRDGIPDGSFDKPGMVPLFEKRMWEFWQEHLKDEIEYSGLYLGYITHMMTDERFILTERPKFFKEIARIGLTVQDRETYVHFNRETDLVDFKLIREYPELMEAKHALERVPAYEICDMITKDELTDSRNWILQYFFAKEHPEEEPEFLKYTSMIDFVEEITKEIMIRLFDEKYLIKGE